MKTFEKRLSKIERIIDSKKHPGVFIIYINNGCFTIANYEENNKTFNNKKDLEDYIFNKYISDKFVFINFDISALKKD